LSDMMGWGCGRGIGVEKGGEGVRDRAGQSGRVRAEGGVRGEGEEG
jgi:hypothetical protein